MPKLLMQSSASHSLKVRLLPGQLGNCRTDPGLRSVRYNAPDQICSRRGRTLMTLRALSIESRPFRHK